jgi:uncharacterized protein YbaA (DUF1428 family)
MDGRFAPMRGLEPRPARVPLEEDTMPRYVDGFVIPIPKKNVPAYRRMARLGAKLWTEYGALEYFECVGDDLAVPYGKTFPKQLKLGRNETAIFAFIVFRSRAHRDRVNAKVMRDPRLAGMSEATMPFDVKRMLMGGFRVIVEGGARPGARSRRLRRAQA